MEPALIGSISKQVEEVFEKMAKEAAEQQRIKKKLEQERQKQEEEEEEKEKEAKRAVKIPFHLRVITGASSNHYKSLIQLLDSLCTHNEPSEVELIVWDLGLTETERKSIEAEYSLTLRIFDYSQYPSYFNIQVAAGEYAWKPTLIYETTKELGDGVYLWLDAGDKVTKSLKVVNEHITRHGIYSPVSDGTISEWTYVKVFDAIEPIYRKYMRLHNRNGAVLGFNTTVPWVKNFVEVFADWAGRKEVIAPEGSSRTNHRQDQALFSLLYWDAQRMHRFDTIANYRDTIRIHQDID